VPVRYLMINSMQTLLWAFKYHSIGEIDKGYGLFAVESYSFFLYKKDGCCLFRGICY